MPTPITGFIADVTSGSAPLTVNITDQSQYATAWYYSVSTIPELTSSDQNPTFIITTPGVYSVIQLLDDGTESWAWQLTKSDYITVDEAPVTCWSFTALYKNSKKFFRLNGPGNCPSELQVPRNIDLSTGVMIEHGKKIDFSNFKF